MGSSTGKKHKKEKKHKHRSHSKSLSVETSGLTDVHYVNENDSMEENEEEAARLHSHSRHSKSNRIVKLYEDSTIATIVIGEDGDSSRTDRRHKHKHKKHKEHKERHKHHKHHREERARLLEEQQVIAVEASDSDSSDCVEVPLDIPPPPVIGKSSDRERAIIAPPPPILSKQVDYDRRERDREREREQKERDRERERERDRDREWDREREKEQRERDREREREKDRERYERDRERFEREREMDRRRERESDRERDRERHVHHERRERAPRERSRSRSRSVPENGAGDCISVEETNRLRAKLGLKPLEVDSGAIQSKNTAAANDAKKGLSAAEKDLSAYKDEWGEFLHKPADNLKDKAEAEKIREKLKQRKEKRFLEERLTHIRSLGESDDDGDDVNNWVQRNKLAVEQKKEAEKRAKALEEMDAEFGVGELVEKEKSKERRKAYSDKNLKGLRVEHDMDDFSEGKTVILTLKDKDVLNEEDGDALINVNMVDDERYRRNTEVKKQNPLSYGYNVYEEQYDQFGTPIERSILEKYDEDIDGKPKQKKNFVIGENAEEEREHKRKLLEIKTKLAGKRLETLADTKIKLAADTFTEIELAKFKKPKKKVKKLRQRLKAEDLVPLANEPTEQHLGNRQGLLPQQTGEEENEPQDSKKLPDLKLDEEDEDDLQRVLSKARKLKQIENIIKKPLMNVEALKQEIKREVEEQDEDGATRVDGNIVLNATAEFCRTLGDIPTYGMAGNRDEVATDLMDYEVNGTVGDERSTAKHEEPEASTGTWNSVDPEDVMKPMELEDVIEDREEVAILDEEPDVGAGVANALRLALSKGYLEKEEHNRPSNTKMAHLQAKNYSIEDKTAADDEKMGRRERFYAGPIMDFRDKDNFKPNVKLDYIDDNGRILSSKEAFRYLSHKFHGKGPGKNKIEKRLKKMEQEGLMKTMSSTDTPLGTLTMLQQKQKETKAPYVVLSGGKQTACVTNTTISKYK